MGTVVNICLTFSEAAADAYGSDNLPESMDCDAAVTETGLTCGVPTVMRSKRATNRIRAGRG
jgi:hypothetical protein